MDQRIKDLEKRIQVSLNTIHHQRGEKQSEKVFVPNDAFITAENKGADTAETEEEDLLPSPGIDTNLLLSSQVSTTANKNRKKLSSKLDSMNERFAFDKNKDGPSLSQINKKSKGIKKKRSP